MLITETQKIAFVSKKLLALVMVFFSIQISIAFAQETEEENEENRSLFTVTAGIGADGVYDSNVFKLPANEQDDFYFVIQPNVNLSLAMRVLTLDISYQPRFVFLSNNFQNDAVDSIIQNLQFSATVFSTDYVQLEVRDRLGAIKTTFDRPDTPDNLSLQNTVNPRLIFTYDFSPRINSELLTEFFRTDIKSPGQDNYRIAVGLSSNYEMTPYLSLVGRGYGDQTVYDSFFIGDQYSLEGEGGFTLNLYDRFSGKFLAGYKKLILPGLNSGNFKYSVDLNAILTELTSLTAQVEENYGTDITGSPVKQTGFSATLKQQLGPRTTFAIHGEHNIYQLPNSSPFKDKTLGGNIQIIYEITERLNANALYEYDKNFGPRNNNDFVDHRFTLGLEYEFGELFKIF